MAEIEYVRPVNLKDALNFLWNHGEDTKIIAGGTDVMIDVRSGALDKKYLLDISRMDELKGIELNDQGLCVGAGVTLSEIYSSDLLESNALALKKTAYNFAGKQIRNMATIGGNVANSSPCGDTLPALSVHRAKALVADKKSTRLVPVEEMATHAYISSLSPKQIIIKFILTPYQDGFADFQKIGRRRELAVSRISMAVFAKKDKEGRIAFLKFALGACTPVPHNMELMEKFLTGKTPTRELIWEAGGLLAQKMIEITGRRSSTIYKEPAIQGLFMRMLYPVVK
ncbi:FAD binding domain-containing protein [Desulfococcaceae bacterium HSG9]|nr:FAD binding domain-containing protein [Desulfococcaceae bacterium HSG9]